MSIRSAIVLYEKMNDQAGLPAASLANLQKKVESFPERIDSAAQAAVNETTKRLTREFESVRGLSLKTL